MRDFEMLLSRPTFGLRQAERESELFPVLKDLTAWHQVRCEPYARVLRSLGWSAMPESVADLPWLPVGVFKSHSLVSVPPSDVFRTITSSGTTGQTVSRIALDRVTAERQTAALARIMTTALGPDRLPMLVLDAKAVARGQHGFAARTAGILGMMTFGRAHTFALRDDLTIDTAAVTDFHERYGRQPFLMFGFTFIAWRHFLKELAPKGLDLSCGILVHSGGWKKLEEEAVSNVEFKRIWREHTGLNHIRNFYGMVEQVGSVFLEGSDGLLYAPAFADVIVRDPKTWDVADIGQPGVIQVVSALPLSYPGHSILTEDLGVVEAIDAGVEGRFGKGFRVLGRAPRTELRGCSDVVAYARGA
jgi:hypothetical protein